MSMQDVKITTIVLNPDGSLVCWDSSHEQSFIKDAVERNPATVINKIVVPTAHFQMARNGSTPFGKRMEKFRHNVLAAYPLIVNG